MHHDVYIRTTLSLEDDLALRLADLARESKKPFKVVVNEALRRGLEDSAPQQSEFLLKPFAGHLHAGIDDRRFNELAWDVGDELANRPATDPGL